ncbi:peptidylprolyl isomerase [Paraglaciecola marina]|uniref:peptidylprolyl isomerase n=1 Tax=Paraglaciecola marina TaxID=2500157 RepID=UPI00105BD9C2|nr:peptidylprolyl isomerase [Paraglaciecola marina]
MNVKIHHIKVSTKIGSFCIQLNAKEAPHTCEYFQNIIHNNKLEEGTIFRVLTAQNQTSEPRIHALQMGSHNALSEFRSHILHEHTKMTGLAHRKWSVSAARYAPGELYQSFFICMRDEPCLDFQGERHPDKQGFACFGEIVSGYDVIEKLYTQAGQQEILNPPIKIESFHLTDSINKK